MYNIKLKNIPHALQVSTLAYKTYFIMILDIVIPMFLDSLKSIIAKNEEKLVSEDAPVTGVKYRHVF